MTAVATEPRETVLSSAKARVEAPIIELEGVRKRFGRRTVLDGITCRFRRGRATGVLGPNAAGKSTLIKVLLGLVCPDAGRVTIDGTVLDGDPSYRSGIGYMPQIARFPDNLTGRKVLTMLRGLREPGTQIDTRLLQGLDLEAQLDKPLRTLSGGTRQKLNAAIAFMFVPRLLILDEPTAGLDPLSSGFLKDRLTEALGRGASVILSSHVMAEVEEMVDDVVFLLEGRIRFQGELDQLRAHTGEERLERAIARLMRGAGC
ncbi:MAG TPA: ABC transporter ATP-binding protein [Gemmatimonadales bacterium]|nr:ABC transporter ATP-binding protein [Gemmatimonadales bacterium]